MQGLRSKRGTIKAIELLVEKGELQSGFLKAKQLGVEPVERAVIEFKDEFTPLTLAYAAVRLKILRDAA